MFLISGRKNQIAKNATQYGIFCFVKSKINCTKQSHGKLTSNQNKNHFILGKKLQAGGFVGSESVKTKRQKYGFINYRVCEFVSKKLKPLTH